MPIITLESAALRAIGCRPFHGLRSRNGRTVLGLTPQALCCRQLRWLCTLIATAVIILAGSPHAFSQSNPSSSPASQTKGPADRNKYALIINGASGEAGYAKQFAQWTAALRGALVGRLGFAEDRAGIWTSAPGILQIPWERCLV